MLETNYSLLDFVRGGCDLKFMPGIDFTVKMVYFWLVSDDDIARI